MPKTRDCEDWLRRSCEKYQYDLGGVFRLNGELKWPIRARSPKELRDVLGTGGHILPLPKEPAALANVLEVSIVDFLLGCVADTPGADARRGTERGYPDLELSGPAFGGGFHAVDVKVARRGVTKTGRLTTSTQSRVTLYTGNTYFRYPTLRWPGTFRPFNDYVSHLDVIGIYTLNEETTDRVDDLELIVQAPWRIASRQRSSTTREYIGAVKDIGALREGRGEFDTEPAFYDYWRKFRFKIGPVVQQQLDRLLASQDGQ